MKSLFRSIRKVVSARTIASVSLPLSMVVVATVVGPSVASASSSGIPSGPIKIGALYSLSGVFAAYGAGSEAINNAVLQEINKTGGIDHHNVVFETANDQSTPNGALAAAHQLLGEGVVGFESMGISPDDLPVAALLDQKKIPGVGLLTDDTYEDGSKWPYVFNDYADAATGATPYGGFLKKLKAHSVAVIHDTTPASILFADHVESSIKSAGIPIDTTVSFDPTAVDLTSEVEQLKASGAQYLIAANVADYPTLYEALHAVGWSPPMIVATAAYYDNVSGLGTLAKTAYAVCNIGLQPGFSYSPQVQAILNTLAAEHAATPDVILSVVSSYDSLLMFKEAIQKTGSVSGPALVKVFDSVRNQGFSDSTMKYTFTTKDHEGVLAKDNYICSLTPLDQYGTPTVYTP